MLNRIPWAREITPKKPIFTTAVDPLIGRTGIRAVFRALIPLHREKALA